MFLFFISTFQAVGQDCPTTTYFLTSQEDVDNFPILFPNCTSLDSGLIIPFADSDITSLSALSQLTNIGGNLVIHGAHQLVNLDGLENLTSIGGNLEISLNNFLQEIDALNNLTNVGGHVDIRQNNQLLHIDGLFSQPTTLKSLNIYSNWDLLTINGFEGVTEIEEYLIIGVNFDMTSINGFNALTQIGDKLRITSHAVLTSLEGFTSLTDIGDNFEFIDNGIENGMGSVVGFGNLNSVGETVDIEGNFIASLDNLIPNTVGKDLLIEQNNLLTDLQPVQSLTEVPGKLKIYWNNSLTNVNGVDNITSVGSLDISFNDDLTDISAFQSLDTIHTNLVMYSNGGIADMTGFSSLVHVRDITLGFAAYFNSLDIISLNGLQGLTEVRNLNFTNSEDLVSLVGLENITKVNNITFSNIDALTDFTGLGGIDTINNLLVTRCDTLQSFQGLNNLENVRKKMTININNSLTNFSGLENLNKLDILIIDYNEELTSLMGLENLQQIDSTFDINSNSNLIDLSPIENTDLSNHLANLVITSNPQLSVCSYTSICDYLLTGGENTISGNNLGCGNSNDVINACFSNQNFTKLQGHVWADLNTDCSADSNDATIPNALVRVQNAFFDYTLSADDSGFYDIPVLLGDYNLSVISPSSFWTPCFPDTMISASGMNDTVFTDFFWQAQGDCPYIDWTFNLNPLRICGTRLATLDFCNLGAQAGEDLMFEINLGNLVSLDSASANFITNTDGNIVFTIDSLDLFECESIELYLFTDCDSVAIDELLCVNVDLIGDELCAPDSLWDGSTTKVTGYCENDSIYFKLENIGSGDMLLPAEFKVNILIEDVVLIHDEGNYQLQSGESVFLTYESFGEGFHIEAQQNQGHPVSSSAMATVPNCDTIINNLILTYFPNNNGDPFSGTFCNTAINSFDPNAKSALPIGTSEEHFIEKDWQLNYTIQFQNTGNDVAYDVVIRDTLSEYLDINTLIVRGASHDFTWAINENRELVFTFANILLPDSTSNEPESHGLVNYSIFPYENLTPLTRIENNAAIYFDFNDPIITNTVFHTIRKPIFSTNEIINICAGDEFNGIVIEQDTVIIDLVEFIEYDSAHATYFSVSETFNTQLVDVQIGDYFENIEINGDTTFSVHHTSTIGCDSIVTFYITAFTVNVNDLENPLQEVKVFPNPASEILFIDATKMGEIQNYTLTNTLGVLVWEKTIAPYQSIESISIRKIPSGVYWLEGKSEEGRRVWKIIVNN